MVKNANEQMRVGNVKKRKMNKTLKFILIFLVIALMVVFFIYLTIYFIRHPEGISGIIG